MIKLSCSNRSIKYSIYHLIKAFLPDEDIDQSETDIAKRDEWNRPGFPAPTGAGIPEGDNSAQAAENGNGEYEYIEISQNGRELYSMSAPKLDKEQTDLAVYDVLHCLTGRDLPWGVLTGVRPVKLAREKIKALGAASAAEYLETGKKVSRPKAKLCTEIAIREERMIRKVLGGQDKDCSSYSMYIGIPVCPSICSYCSFSSGPLSLWGSRMDDYVDALTEELSLAAGWLNDLKLTSIYIGGGTPTVLTPPQLMKLLDCIGSYFPAGLGVEYTLEAGRPDTVTEEKLVIARDHGVNRLSINPQSMQQKTLDRIGRGHTVSRIYEAYDLARRLGYDNINMDIITGLPGEDANDMEDTLRQIEKLSPDSLTVHALAIKRAARLKKQSADAALTDRMIEMAADVAREMGMIPYYLYRQKSIAGNHENTGYAKPGKECIYNVMIMEEVQSIAAFGAGAVSKVILPVKEQNPDRAEGVMTSLLRQENVSNISDYIDRAREMAEKKEKTFDNIILPC